MKAILLALSAGALLFAVGTWQSRRATGTKGASAWLASFLAILPLLAITHLLTPPDLGILPRDFQIPLLAVDLAFCMFLYAAGFFGGLLQLYNLADRGFSLRILIDILHAPSGAMMRDDVFSGYGGGQGVAWMYRKRIDGMIATGLVIAEAGRLILTARGRRAAHLLSALQDFACVPKARDLQ
jgi:hypothetical protein